MTISPKHYVLAVLIAATFSQNSSWAQDVNDTALVPFSTVTDWQCYAEAAVTPGSPTPLELLPSQTLAVNNLAKTMINNAANAGSLLVAGSNMGDLRQFVEFWDQPLESEGEIKFLYRQKFISDNKRNDFMLWQVQSLEDLPDEVITISTCLFSNGGSSVTGNYKKTYIKFVNDKWLFMPHAQ